MPLFAAKGGATASDLYTLNPTSGGATAIGPIGHSVTGLAFDPTSGVLYGVTGPQSPSNPRSLITINPATGAGTLVGALGGGTQPVPDIAFASDGTLYGWSQVTQDLVTINKATGARSAAIGDSGINSFGDGLDIDGSDEMYAMLRGVGDKIWGVNLATGAVDAGVDLVAGPPIETWWTIGAASFDSAGTLFMLANDYGDETWLCTVDPDGTIQPRGETLPGMDALAWSGSKGTFSTAPPPPPSEDWGFVAEFAFEDDHDATSITLYIDTPVSANTLVLIPAFGINGNPDERPINQPLTSLPPITVPVSCTDTQGNTYTLLPASGQTAMFASTLGARLGWDDFITVTWDGDTDLKVAQAWAFRGAMLPPLGDLETVAASGPGGRPPYPTWEGIPIASNAVTEGDGAMTTTEGSIEVEGMHRNGMVWGYSEGPYDAGDPGVWQGRAWRMDSLTGEYALINTNSGRVGNVNSSGVASGATYYHPDGLARATLWDADGNPTYLPPQASEDYGMEPGHAYLGAVYHWITDSGVALGLVSFESIYEANGDHQEAIGWDGVPGQKSWRINAEDPVTGKVIGQILNWIEGNPTHAVLVDPSDGSYESIASPGYEYEVTDIYGDRMVGYAKIQGYPIWEWKPVIWDSGVPTIYDLGTTDALQIFTSISEDGTIGGRWDHNQSWASGKTFFIRGGDPIDYNLSANVPNEVRLRTSRKGYGYYYGSVWTTRFRVWARNVEADDGKLRVLFGANGIDYPNSIQASSDPDNNPNGMANNGVVLREPEPHGMTCPVRPNATDLFTPTSPWANEENRLHIAVNVALLGPWSASCFSEAIGSPSEPTGDFDNEYWGRYQDYASYPVDLGVAFQMITSFEVSDGPLPVNPNAGIDWVGDYQGVGQTNTDDDKGAPWQFLGYSIPGFGYVPVVFVPQIIHLMP